VEIRASEATVPVTEPTSREAPRRDRQERRRPPAEPGRPREPVTGYQDDDEPEDGAGLSLLL
jgi:hypothetical protein